MRLSVSRLFLLVIFLSAGGCAGHVPFFSKNGGGHEMLNAALWQQTSAEYLAVVEQSYQLAKTQLDRALLDRQWTAALEQLDSYQDLSPAVMLDIDETVIDNSRYEARIIRRHGQYSVETFNQWCAEQSATVVPGAREFLDYAARRGVTIFYYSARKEILRQCTASTLQRLGLPFADVPGSLLLDDGRKKWDYRSSVAKKHRILLLVGDNLEDFLSSSKSGPAKRKDLVHKYKEYWGRKWIVLPNPMYGHWEASLYEFQYHLPRNKILDKKKQWLQD